LPSTKDVIAFTAPLPAEDVTEVSSGKRAERSITASTCTTCPYCGVGCGVIANVNAGKLVGVRGDPDHPANRGKLCVKGSTLHETAHLTGRLLKPRIDGESVSWSAAIEATARAIGHCRDNYGPDSVAFYVSGQLLTEDYYVANKLMKGFIGSANIDTNSRLCMSSAVAAHKRAFGEDVVPGNYDDILLADLLLVVGANPAWTHPVLYQRRMQSQAEQCHKKMIVIDPRRTVTAGAADLHLPIKPGADAIFFLGLARWLIEQALVDDDFIRDHCEGYDVFAVVLADWSVSRVARETELTKKDLLTAFEWFAQTPRVVTFFSQGINQSSSGVDKGNAIINCHLMTGRIGKPGACPWSITGQPNAMGGREVGGLANQLAAHLALENPTHRQRVQAFWQSPKMAEKQGYTAVELFQKMHAGAVKCIWIMATNPLVSLPDRAFVREALNRCDHVIVSEVLENTDTLAAANICLPAAAWGEKSGTVTNSERCISRQKQFLPLPGAAKPDWLIISEVASALGWQEAFNYKHPVEIFREYAQLTALGNGLPFGRGVDLPRALNLEGLSNLTEAQYNALKPTQWPVREQGRSTARLFVDGRFWTDAGTAQFVPVTPKLPIQQTSVAYPFIVNSGRVRDHWHTMTRTGRSGRLAGHSMEPMAVFHSEDFQNLCLDPQALVQLKSPFGKVLLRPMDSVEQRRGEVFVPIHWNDSVSANAGIGALFGQVVDPLSGQPELKHGVAAVKAVTPQWQASFFSLLPLSRRWLSQWGEYWSLIRLPRGYRTILASLSAPPAGDFLLSQLHAEVLRIGQSQGDQLGAIEETLVFDGLDSLQKNYRAGLFSDDGLLCGLWMGAHLDVQRGASINGLFPSSEGEALVDSLQKIVPRSAVISQNAMDDITDGRIICACFGVSADKIAVAVRDGCTTTNALGEALSCGKGCGTCLPELARVLSDHDDEPVARTGVSA
jgi:assimilatory nitrate reductase catalytic subunit